MLAGLATHARIVSAVPTDAFVEQRKAAITELLAQDLAQDTLVAFAEFATFGISQPLSKTHAWATQVLYKAIHAHQASFVNDVEATQMDLRLVAAVSLGELLSSQPTNAKSLHLAALLRATARLRAQPPEVHLAKLVAQLLELADRTLMLGAQKLRVRRALPIANVAGTDAEAVGADMNNLVRVLKENLLADREELNVLWWVFGARSRTGKRFDTLPLGERVLVTATELCERMLMPPIRTASHLLRAVVAELTAISTAQLAVQVSKESLEAFLGDHRDGALLPDAHPTLLPLTWLCTRLLASDLSPGWEPEFEKRTKLDPRATFSADTWALQLMDELVARKLDPSAALDRGTDNDEEAEEAE